jgi:transcriptional pleiotropic repressor
LNGGFALDDVEALKRIVASGKSEKDVVVQIADFLCNSVRSNILLVNSDGTVVCEKLIDSVNIFKKNDDRCDVPCIDDEIMNILNGFDAARYNVTIGALPVKSAAKSEAEGYKAAFLPVEAIAEHFGIMIAYREKSAFTRGEARTMETAATVLSLLCRTVKISEGSSNERMQKAVRSAVSALSFTELEAAKAIFDDMHGDDTVVVLSKIADNAKITRSIMINSLKKLEGAGVIHTRSLGMKGTYISIDNRYLKDALKQ